MLRGDRVILDADIAALYGVPTRALVQAVKRNHERFPPDFMLQLSREELSNLRSQFVISSLAGAQEARQPQGGRRSLPLAFTEQGVAMLSGVLRRSHAVHVNIEIMRAFGAFLQAHDELRRKVNALEENYDSQFKAAFRAIRALTDPEEESEARPERIGFRHEKHPAPSEMGNH